MQDLWKETKKEYEIKDGFETLTKVTRENTFKYRRYEKERWLFFFQGISAFGIIIAFVGIIANSINQDFQNKNQIKNQKALYDIAVYSNAIKFMNVITDNRVDDTVFFNASDKLHSEVIPSIILLKNDSLARLIRSYDDLLESMKAIYKTKKYIREFRDDLSMFIYLYESNQFLYKSSEKNKNTERLLSMQTSLSNRSNSFFLISKYFDDSTYIKRQFEIISFPNFDSAYSYIIYYYKYIDSQTNACSNVIHDLINGKHIDGHFAKIQEGSSTLNSLEVFEFEDYITTIANHYDNVLDSLKVEMITVMQKSNILLN